jgi:hypothetical protein
MRKIRNTETSKLALIDELSESRSDGVSEQGLSEVFRSELNGKEDRKRPYLLLQKYQFFRGSRKRLAFWAD